jgi:hypothetical protein
MGLTIAAGDPFATFITGEVSGAIGWRSPLYVFGRGSGGVSGVLFLRNGDTGGTTPRGEDSYARVADTPTSFEVAATIPV